MNINTCMIKNIAKFGYICFFAIIVFAMIDFEVNVNTGNVKTTDDQQNETVITKDSIDKNFKKEWNK